MKQSTYLYFIGTAGSGKSTLTAYFQEWIKQHGLDAVIVNLDPGAEILPYEPDVDIRDWIKLTEIMETEELGPNGAQIVCADMIALNLEDIKKSIQTFKSDYIFVDTPGQLELFVFREAGKYTVENLKPEYTMICYLLDPILARTASGFVTQLLLSITTNFRLQKPQINILSKADLLSEPDREIITKWSNDPEELYGSIIFEEKSIYREMSEGILRLIKDFGGHTQLIPVSKKGYAGIEDVYTQIQFQYAGGEDLTKD
ncbi:MAG: ATP/GTP-binding protein [Candidatus Thermoplasmatota archaeon]